MSYEHFIHNFRSSNQLKLGNYLDNYPMHLRNYRYQVVEDMAHAW